MPWPSLVVAGIEHIGDQHRVVDRRDLDAALGEHVPVELHVLADLEHAGVFEQRLQQRERLAPPRIWPGARPPPPKRSPSPCAMADRDVAGLARRDGERDADEIGLHRIERSRLGVEGDDAGVVGARDPAARVRPASSPSDRRRRRPSRPLRAPRARSASACGVASPVGAGAGLAAARAAAARRAAPAGPWPRHCVRASRPRRRSAGPARPRSASTPQISPTRRVMVVNSIAFRKAISFSPSSFGMPSVVERRLDRRRRAPA